MSLRKLIQAVLPNFSSKELRSMVPWFDAVSGMLDDGSVVIAAAHVSGGAFQKNFGFQSPPAHPSVGNYILTYTEVQDINRLIPMVAITGQATPAGALSIYPNLTDPSTVTVNVWQILQTTAVRSQVDADFFLMVTRIPAP